MRRAANAANAPAGKTREEKIGEVGFQMIEQSVRARVELQVGKAMLVKQCAGDVEIPFDFREIRNVLKYEERVDEIVAAGIAAGLAKEIFGAGDGQESDVGNAVVARKSAGALNHFGGDVDAEDSIEIMRKRKGEAAEATAEFERHPVPEAMRAKKREEFGLDDLLAAAPEEARIGVLHLGENVEVGIDFGETFPGMAGLCRAVRIGVYGHPCAPPREGIAD